MVARKKPIGEELQQLLLEYHATDHRGKLRLAKKKKISYDTLRNWANQEEKPLPPEPTFPKSLSMQEHFRIFKDMERLTKYHLQAPIEVTINIDTDKPIALVDLADMQIGEPGVDYDSMERDIELIATEPGVNVELGGDAYENIIQPSKVGSSHNQIPITNQRGLYVLIIKYLKDSLTVMRTGNHNWWSYSATGEDWEAELARRLKVVYTKHFGKIYYKVGDMVYPKLAMHKGRFNSSFNATHPCKQYQRLYFPEARIVTIEHNHIGDMEQARYNERECVYIRTGTYAVYDDHAFSNGYFGAHVCNPAVVLFPYEDKLVGFKDFHDAVTFLRAVRN